MSDQVAQRALAEYDQSMPTIGYVTVKPGNIYHAMKTAAQGGASEIFVDSNGFALARAFVEGAIAGKAKLRDATRHGADGGVGGPKTYEIYT